MSTRKPASAATSASRSPGAGPTSAAAAGLRSLKKPGQLSTAPIASSGAGTSTRAAAYEGNADAQFERLTGAVNDEQLGTRIASVKTMAENDPAFVAQLGAVISNNDYAWLAVMQRVFNDVVEGGDEVKKAQLVELICMLGGREDPKLRTTLLATKLSSILTVRSKTVQALAARCVMRCVSTASDIETFLQRMQGYENVATFVGSAQLEHSATLIANFVGKCPSIAGSLCEHEVDVRLLRAAFKALSGLKDGPTAPFAATLYALRFFVRVKQNDMAYAERCLSLCAHAAAKLPMQSSDLAADICQVTTKLTFVQTHPNILLNLCAGCAPWRAGASRKLPIATFLARSVTAHEKKDMGLAAMRCYRGCVSLIDVEHDGPNRAAAPPELVQLLLHAALCVVRCTPPKYGSKFMDYVQLARARDVIFKAPPSQTAVATAAERWLSLVWTLVHHAPHANLALIVTPVADMVSRGFISPEAFQRATGKPYVASEVAAFDRNVEAMLDSCKRPVAELVAAADSQWGALQDAEVATRQKIAKHFVSELDEIKNSSRYRYFMAMVLPGCQRITADAASARARSDAATASVAASASPSLISPRSETTPPTSVAAGGAGDPMAARHAAAQRALTQLVPSGAGASAEGGANVERDILPMFQTLEVQFADKRNEWYKKQSSVVWRARAEYAEECKSNPIAFDLRVVELEEETTRGFGWFGVTYAPLSEDPITDETLDQECDTKSKRPELPIALAEARQRARLEARFQQGLDSARPVTEQSMQFLAHSASGYTAAGMSWRMPKEEEDASPNVGEAMHSVTSLLDLGLDTIAERFKRSVDPVADLLRFETRSRGCVASAAFASLMEQQLEFHEALLRDRLHDAYRLFVGAAELCSANPAARAIFEQRIAATA